MELRERVIEWWLKGDFETQTDGTGIGFLNLTPEGWEFSQIACPQEKVLLPKIDTQKLDVIRHLDALSGSSSLMVVRESSTGLSFHAVTI